MKKIIELSLKIINFILKPLRMILLKKSIYDFLIRENNVLIDFNDIHTNLQIESNNLCSCIIFSMDRALQLHSLLSSFYENVKNPCKIFILYKASNNKHDASYNEVFNIFKDRAISVTKQSLFKNDLINIMREINSDKIFFLVDDIIFIEEFNLLDICKYDPCRFIPSLRLGMNLTNCYTKHCKQNLPEFKSNLIHEKGKIFWKWENGALDWSYPLSVDGHIFSRKEILSCTENINFSSPNTYESNLQIFNKLFRKRIGVAYEKSRLVNIPLNKVQIEFNNRSGNLHADYLMDLWNKGMQIDYKKIYGYKNNDVHQEIEMSFIKRI